MNELETRMSAALRRLGSLRSLQPLGPAPGQPACVRLSTGPVGGHWATPSSCPVAVTCRPPGPSASLKDLTFFLPVSAPCRVPSKSWWWCWGADSRGISLPASQSLEQCRDVRQQFWASYSPLVRTQHPLDGSGGTRTPEFERRGGGGLRFGRLPTLRRCCMSRKLRATFSNFKSVGLTWGPGGGSGAGPRFCIFLS